MFKNVTGITKQAPLDPFIMTVLLLSDIFAYPLLTNLIIIDEFHKNKP